MLTEVVLIGQGISGTWLSYYLRKKKIPFLVIDIQHPHSASRLAAGIINPVTGRRHVEVWLADEILPFAWEMYTEFGAELGITAISQKELLDFFPSAQMRLSFQQRVEENGRYVSLEENTDYRSLFQYDFGFGKIKPVYTAHLESILPAWRKILEQDKLLLEEDFDPTQLVVEENKIRYKDIIAEKIIFCDGAGNAGQHWFGALPFAPNKGELLLLEIPSLPSGTIYKKGIMLAPMAAEGSWWAGSSYDWYFEDHAPTPLFREKTEALLRSWLKIPFKVMAHEAGIRPATIERRPFVGFHPLYPSVGILNGMGTKGCSLAPFFAWQLVHHLCEGKPLKPEADVMRFRKILSRNSG